MDAVGQVLSLVYLAISFEEGKPTVSKTAESATAHIRWKSRWKLVLTLWSLLHRWVDEIATDASTAPYKCLWWSAQQLSSFLQSSPIIKLLWDCPSSPLWYHCTNLWPTCFALHVWLRCPILKLWVQLTWLQRWIWPHWWALSCTSSSVNALASSLHCQLRFSMHRILSCPGCICDLLTVSRCTDFSWSCWSTCNWMHQFIAEVPKLGTIYVSED